MRALAAEQERAAHSGRVAAAGRGQPGRGRHAARGASRGASPPVCGSRLVATPAGSGPGAGDPKGDAAQPRHHRLQNGGRGGGGGTLCSAALSEHAVQAAARAAKPSPSRRALGRGLRLRRRRGMAGRRVSALVAEASSSACSPKLGGAGGGGLRDLVVWTGVLGVQCERSRRKRSSLIGLTTRKQASGSPTPNAPRFPGPRALRYLPGSAPLRFVSAY